MQKEDHKLCTYCGERNNPSFSSCWKCEAPFQLSVSELALIQSDQNRQEIKSFWSKVLVYTLLVLLLGYLFVPSLIYQIKTSFGKNRVTVDRIALNNYSFEYVPTNWRSIGVPPHSISITPPNNPYSLRIYLNSLRGTKFVALVEQTVPVDPQKADYIGIVALVERQSSLGTRFNSVDDPILEQTAKNMLIGERNMKYSVVRSMFPILKNEVAEEIISGNKWKIFTSIHEVATEEAHHLTIYWTTSGSTAIFVLTQAFGSFDSQIAAESRKFIESFKVRDS